MPHRWPAVISIVSQTVEMDGVSLERRYRQTIYAYIYTYVLSCMSEMRSLRGNGFSFFFFFFLLLAV